MKVICWNMAAGFGFDVDRHEAAWRWLLGQHPDVALLQEVVAPPALDADWQLIAHSQKYSTSGVAWGSAVLVRASTLYRPYAPADTSWLAELTGSVSIAEPLEEQLPWLVSLHSNAYPIPPERLADRDLSGVRVCKPGALWEVEAAAHELEPLLSGHRFLVGGDLNSSLLFDKVNGYPWNRALFANLLEAGFIDLRARHSPMEQRTYFKTGRRPYQLDHVFGDALTESLVNSWSVRTEVAEQHDLSDHAAIVVEIGDH